MNTSELDKVFQVYDESLMGSGKYGHIDMDDLKEYDRDMLSRRFELSDEGGTELYELIQGYYRTPSVSFHKSNPKGPLESVMTEAIHTGFDGWPSWKLVVIHQFVNDLQVAAGYEESE